MDDPRARAARFAAADRAREYQAQADAYWRLATLEPIEQKRRLLALSAAKYEQLAAAEEQIVLGGRRDQRGRDPRELSEHIDLDQRSRL